MKTRSLCLVWALGLLGVSVAACSQSSGSGSSATPATSDTAPAGKPSGASASGDSVGAPECDEALKKAAAADCKDKPGMSAIVGNREQWKSGLSNASTKDATIMGCKGALDSVKMVCGSGGPPGSGSGGPVAAPGASGSPGMPAADSVGAPECDEVLAKAAAPDCKDKPGMSAIGANRGVWKMGLSVAISREPTIQMCKQTMETVKTACGLTMPGAPGGAAANWDGKTPYECGGNTTATITGVTANITSGPAINAGGNCVVTFKDCNITTDKGVEAGGNAQVTLDGGELKASDTAIDAGGNAQVTVKNAKVTGKVHQTGNGKVTGVPVTK